MSAAAIAEAKREAVLARQRAERSFAALRDRLQPGSLAEEAWDGVKDKSAEVADNALQAVKSRPKAVSLALGALAIFLARQPLKRAVSRLISGDEQVNEDEDAELSVTEGVS
jgi:DNA invertase Pin-like site-specific DNA recombinase